MPSQGAADLAFNLHSNSTHPQCRPSLASLTRFNKLLPCRMLEALNTVSASTLPLSSVKPPFAAVFLRSGSLQGLRWSSHLRSTRAFTPPHFDPSRPSSAPPPRRVLGPRPFVKISLQPTRQKFSFACFEVLPVVLCEAQRRSAAPSVQKRISFTSNTTSVELSPRFGPSTLQSSSAPSP